MAPCKDGCGEIGSVSGRVISPKWSTQCMHLSEQDLRLELSGVFPDKGVTRCSIHPGQAHLKPQEHPVPTNNTANFIEGSCGGWSCKAWGVVRWGDDPSGIQEQMRGIGSPHYIR